MEEKTMACIPNVYAAASGKIALKIKNGELDASNKEQLLNEAVKMEGSAFANGIVEFALKLLKYPDVMKAAMHKDYRNEYDKNTPTK